MWLRAPGLIQPTCSCTASSTGSSRCLRERASCPPPRSEWPWRSESRAPPSQPPDGGPSTCSTAARSATVGAASRRWMSISLRGSWPARRRAALDSRSGVVSLSTRTAQALNSAVPLFGSVTSIVSRFVSTWSGKWNVMNVRPGPQRRIDVHRRLDGAAARRHAHDLALLEQHALGVLGRDVERLAAMQRRAVAVGLHARVVRLEPAAGGQAHRVLGVERLERRLVHDRRERRRLALERLGPQPRVQERRARCSPRRGTATGCRRAPRASS